MLPSVGCLLYVLSHFIVLYIKLMLQICLNSLELECCRCDIKPIVMNFCYYTSAAYYVGLHVYLAHVYKQWTSLKGKFIGTSASRLVWQTLIAVKEFCIILFCLLKDRLNKEAYFVKRAAHYNIGIYVFCAQDISRTSRPRDQMRTLSWWWDQWLQLRRKKISCNALIIT